MLTSNVAEAYGFVRTPVADETGAPADLPDIEIIFAPVPYVGEGLVPPPARASPSARSCCSHEAAEPSGSHRRIRSRRRSSIPDT